MEGMEQPLLRWLGRFCRAASVIFLHLTGIRPPLPCSQLRQSDTVYQTQNDEVAISRTYLNRATNARALCEPLDDFDLSFSPRSFRSGLDTLIT